ncbi:CD3337/EF1877 family mobilome membrane protein [Thomasclavelia sp.]
MDAKATGKKIIRFVGITLLVAVGVFLLLALTGTVAHAAGLVDDTVSDKNQYSKYPLSNYQLDFYVDNSWGWLPWNWGDGIGKSVMYGLYCITNFIWTIGLYLSNATGYVIEQAYKLDFINDMADSIGESMQTIAGVTANGFSSSGFYVGFLLILILAVGIYVAYVGLLKRETSKALHAVINFLVVFLVSASFIAYAPDYIKKVNEFSSDISTAALDMGTKIILPDSSSKGKDSVDLIRDSLFAIQVKQPWMLLQFGNSDVEKIGADRVEGLLSTSPSEDDGKTREEVVKTEIEGKDNDNLSLPQVVNRLGMVFFLLLFNLGITIFVFLLTGMMIFSQILFIIFAMFLPVSFLLSMIPSYENMAKQAIVRVFNTIMMRAGITLIITVAFAISSMFYKISAGYPFFMVAFLQITTFAGIYFKLGDLMSMFSLNSNDSQNLGRRMFRRPYMFMRHGARRAERRIARAVGAGALTGAAAGAATGSYFSGSRTKKPASDRQNRSNASSASPPSMGKCAGAAVGAVADTKNRIKDKAAQVRETVKDVPTQAAYAVHATKEKAKESASDFKRGIMQEQQTRQDRRTDRMNRHRQNIADKRMAMQKAQESGQQGTGAKASPAGSSHPYERPAAAPKPETKAKDKRPVAETPQAEHPAAREIKRPVAAGSSPILKEPAIPTVESKPAAQRKSVNAAGDGKTAVSQTVQRTTKESLKAARTVQSQQNREITQQNRQTTSYKKGRRK